MKRNKIFYIPGMISLIFLPLLLIFMGPEEVIGKTAVWFHLPYDHLPDSNLIGFSRDGVLSLLKGKTITSIILSNYNSDELESYRKNQKMAYIKSAVEKLTFNNDTTQVVKVRFTENSTYGDFMWVLNQTTLYGVTRFAYLDNSIYFFAHPPYIPEDQVQETLPLETYDTIYLNPEAPASKLFLLNQWWKAHFQVTNYYLRKNIFLLSGFLILIVLPGAVSLFNRKQWLT